jgi:hypothetical protein
MHVKGHTWDGSTYGGPVIDQDEPRAAAGQVKRRKTRDVPLEVLQFVMRGGARLDAGRHYIYRGSLLRSMHCGHLFYLPSSPLIN